MIEDKDDPDDGEDEADMKSRFLFDGDTCGFLIMCDFDSVDSAGEWLVEYDRSVSVKIFVCEFAECKLVDELQTCFFRYLARLFLNHTFLIIPR